MARQSRLVIPFQAHQLVQRGNDGQLIFRDNEDYSLFLQWLREAARQQKVAIHAYVLMPDHFHLLVSPSGQDGLGRMMQWIGRHYVPYFNRKYERSGSLWQGRFRASVIDSERYFMTCCCYIELNPVRAGIVASPAEFLWSSYTHHIGARPDALITDHPLYWALGNTPFQREAAYRTLIEQGLTPEETKMLNQAMLKGWALGSEQFKDGLEKRLNRRVRPAKRGRPKKLPEIRLTK